MLFKKRVKNNEDNNPFTDQNIRDRRIEKFKDCLYCNNELKVVEYDKDKNKATLKCPSCGAKYIFRNWEEK